ncbi:HEPN domain-containing protein [Candidatus Thiothrix anitrata]|uniref:Apea-like HEPN domain-containing protein n=1 Tax=Candidatus Thiothrix anitrata TaxID=2823902 RepID=A0ABX7WZA0_9GAMM|nr:HEPN domain-containing protein [Candidatus Thiothrix anitrata]QTR48955.1 hypothetical protein J8380_11780 [Candidatus Thiothrix anitrata]
MDKIIGQIIVLTKNIFLSSPDGSRNGMEQFFVGKSDPFRFTGGFGLSWWYTKLSFKTVENISFLINSQLIEFSGCDHKSIQCVIRDTLHEICVDKKIFNGDLVCFGGKNNLFECKIESDVKKYGIYILDAILENIRKSIASRSIIYAAPRITGQSFSISSEKLHIIHKYDRDKWNKLLDLGYCTDQWNPASGNFMDGQTTAFSSKKYDYVFVAETEGTIEGSRFSASLKFRKLFSVISAIIEYSFRSKVMARPYSMCLQIPHSKSQEKNFTLNEIGELFPYYGNEIKLNESNILKIKQWYETEQNLTSQQRNRIEKCAHFINKGMNSSDIESYIHYFVALDALYGKIGSVFNSIEEGINRLPDSNYWNKKISWLFDLRNELVHGGSRYIEEWPKYMRYYRHFEAEPVRDIEKLVFHALASAPFSHHELNNKI